MVFRGVKPYITPHRMPFVLEGRIEYWDMQHDADQYWPGLNEFWNGPEGPDPQLFGIQDIAPYLWHFLYHLSGIDIGPVPGPAEGTGGGDCRRV